MSDSRCDVLYDTKLIQNALFYRDRTLDVNVRLHNQICKRVFPRECFQESVSKRVFPRECFQESISKRVFPREYFQESVSKKSALDLKIDTYNDKTDLRRIKLTVLAF